MPESCKKFGKTSLFSIFHSHHTKDIIMGKLHELLAIEKTKTTAANKMLTETNQKFGKFDYF